MWKGLLPIQLKRIVFKGLRQSHKGFHAAPSSKSAPLKGGQDQLQATAD